MTRALLALLCLAARTEKESIAVDFVEELPAAKATERLIIDEGDAPSRMTVAGGRIDGERRGAEVQVDVTPTAIEGHLAGEPVFIWLHGREAEGHIGGRDVGFTIVDTPTGHLLRGHAVGHTVRFEEAAGTLSWLPACERPLVRLPRAGTASVYQGACASGRRVRLTMPDALDDLPPLPRLVLLALLLTEREDDSAAPRLFPERRGR
jgi:hypothetical protein